MAFIQGKLKYSGISSIQIRNDHSFQHKFMVAKTSSRFLSVSLNFVKLNNLIKKTKKKNK